MSVKNDIDKLVKKKLREGWREEFGKHRKIYHPKGGFVSMSISPSCVHAAKNIERDIRKLEKQHEKEIA